jgi:hypothetical protein
MKTMAEIERRLDDVVLGRGATASHQELLDLGEQVLAHWARAKSLQPTEEPHEGFRLLALHRQGAQKDPSFNACRETCRELVFHYNLVIAQHEDEEPAAKTMQMMALVANHLVLFVGGKMVEAGLGDFCCSAKPLHQDHNLPAEISNA